MKSLRILALFSAASLVSAVAADRPNIVFILADDLGYGDVSCNNPEGKIQTPHIDRMAAAGMRFTDGHSTSGVCTPTRYSILTGRYNWRTRMQLGVLGGLSPHLIEPDRMTVGHLLRQHGYRTAVIGKWHLGMDWPRKPGTAEFRDNIEKGYQGWTVDYTLPISHGPNTVGFDDFYGISGSLDMVPFTYIENDRVTDIPTVDKDFPKMPGDPKLTSGTRWVIQRTHTGPAAADFEVEDVLPRFTQKAVEYIAHRAEEAKQGKPFFLYLPLNSPHAPFAPTKEWEGKSGLNPSADFMMQTDDTVGQVIRALEEHGLVENTLVIFTSDNGCAPQSDFPTLLAKGHNPSYIFRGQKADVWEGGHRVAFIAQWPAKIPAGTTSDQLVCSVDFMATTAEILGVKLPDNAGEDSVSLLPVMLGKAKEPVREALVHHTVSGKFGIRQGKWKLALCPGSGGWTSPTDAEAIKLGLPDVQLYDMENDIGELRNMQGAHPEIVKRMVELLEKYVAQGRSTPGSPQLNDTSIDIWKHPTRAAAR